MKSLTTLFLPLLASEFEVLGDRSWWAASGCDSPRMADSGDKTWQRTLGDIEAVAHLGLYCAEKPRAADTKEKQPQQAAEHLKRAVVHWKNYATIGQRQYKPQSLSKGGPADWRQGYENAKRDVILLEGK